VAAPSDRRRAGGNALMLPCVSCKWRPSPKMKEAIFVKRTRIRFVASFFFSIGLIGASSIAQAQSGIASVYSGGKTSSGESASASGMTAAHRTLPFGTLVRITHRRSGRSVVVRINDRGPFVRGRVIDVTPAAARALGFSGLASVTLDVIGRRG
jgi:rare lipoprotein A